MASTKRLPLIRNESAPGAPACLVQIYGEPLGRRFELSGEETTIGRDEENTISLRVQSVSRKHLRIFNREGRYWVEDLESTNGTFVNDGAVGAPAQLRNGDLIRCGGAVFKFIEGGNVESLYHEEIHRLTITDGLTQLANKRHFQEFLGREIAHAMRHQRPLALVMFDIDHFKKINDEHGHVAGDRVLCGVAELMAPEVRQDELLARWGGEEFAIVLPESALEGAERVAERIRRIIEQAEFEHDRKILRVTVSAGVTSLRNDDTPRSLIERADAHLYHAKETGRNRVCSLSQLPGSDPGKFT